MLGVGAGGVERYVRLHVVRCDDSPLEHVGLDFLSTDVRQHDPVDLHARGEGLSAALLHLEPESRILDDVLLGVGKGVLVHDGAHSLAPSARGLEVGGDFWL